MKDYFHVALENLNHFDWILLLWKKDYSDIHTQHSNNSTHTIMEQGIGLSTLLYSARSKPMTQLESLSPESIKILMDINQWDYQIWMEAQRLHEFYRLSLEYMEKYASDLLDVRKKEEEDDDDES